LLSQFTNIIRRSCSVVAVGHVEARNLLELLHEKASIFLRALPQDVPDTVITCYISVARGRDDMSHAILDGFLVLAEGQENGADVGTLHIGQLGPVSLLLGEGKLVTLDEFVFVVLD